MYNFAGYYGKGDVFLVTKLRLFLLAILLIPQGVMFGMIYGSLLATNKYLSQIQSMSLICAILLALIMPSLIIKWLVGKRLGTIRHFCLRIKERNYKERLSLPNESRDGDGEDEITVLMRDMNWMARQIEMREHELQQVVHDLSQSRGHIIKQNDILVTANVELLITQQRLHEQTLELENICREVQSLAMTDALTSIANRRCFFDTMERQFAAMVCHCRPISLLMLDIDWFKTINDTYGHQAGDQVLLELARMIQKSARKEDLAARIGGEEYALLLPDTSSQAAVMIARRIQEALANHVFILDGNKPVSITVSIGICTLSQLPCLDRENLYHYADQALYHSKHSGRNSISVYDPSTGAMNQVTCSATHDRSTANPLRC